MCFRRSDGKKVKDLQIIEKATPYFMPQRIDAVNMFTQNIRCEGIDKFIIKQKNETGVHYSYTEIVMAACVRMLYQRPKTNRFINNCVIYQRNKISISMSVKKSLTDNGEEVTLKFYFTGRESLPEVKKIIDDEIAKNIPSDAEVHETTKAAGVLCKLPNWLFKFAMSCVRFMDKHNMLPKKLIHASPFHTSLYITDLKSIKLDKIYHHLYNFGNTSIFAALGKVLYVPVGDRSGEVKVEKIMRLGLTLDERICDGLYYGTSVRQLLKDIEDPDRLMTALPDPELTGKARKKKEKQDKKTAKKIAKASKKSAKKSKKIQQKYTKKGNNSCNG